MYSHSIYCLFATLLGLLTLCVLPLDWHEKHRGRTTEVQPLLLMLSTLLLHHNKSILAGIIQV